MDNLSPSKIIFISISILAGIGLIFGVGWGLSYLTDTYVASKTDGLTNAEDSDSKIAIPNLKNLKEKTNLEATEDRTNILMLGISGEQYISGNLADTIMTATIDSKNNELNLISIPRDLWISTDGKYQKINELYRISGGTEKPSTENVGLIKSKIEEITGLQIHYSAIINLEGIKNIVDLLGGVETEEGELNGEQALIYIRDRSRPGGDFDRIERQQKLIIAILDKMGSEGLGDAASSEKDILELFNAFEKYFATDLSVFHLMILSEKINAIDTFKMYSIVPSTENLLYSDYTNVNGQQIYTLHPTAGYEDYSKIREFINTKLNNKDE